MLNFFLLQFSFFSLLGCSLFGLSDYPKFNFKTELKEDEIFVSQFKTQFRLEGRRIEKYWDVKTPESISIEILPVFKNSDFKNCARNYGLSKIYAHSPSSLASLQENNRQGINPNCFKINYDNLGYSLLREYSHILHLIYLDGKVSRQNWLWQGLAVYSSGELYSDLTRKNILHITKKIKNLNICDDKFLEKNPAEFGALTVAYFESQAKGLAKEFSRFSKNEQVRLLKKLEIPCSLPIEKALAAIPSFR